jgi:hypothetical protein
MDRAKQNYARQRTKERNAWKKEKPILIEQIKTKNTLPTNTQKSRARLASQASPLAPDGARARGADARSRSAVSGAISDIKAAGLPIHKNRTRRTPEVPGVKVKKGWRAGTVDVLANSDSTFNLAMQSLKGSGEIVFRNTQGRTFSFRPRRKP